MKTISGSIAILLLFVTLPSCHGWWMGTVNGNNHVISEKRSVAGFSKVSLAGPFDVELTPGEEYAVSIETDENLMEYINVDKDGSRLKIKVREGVNIRSRNGIKIKISMPRTDAVDFAGSGTFHVNGTIRNDEKVNISMAGSASFEGAFSCPETKFEIAGSGSINASGQTRTSEIDIAGSGDYLGDELLAEEVKISIAGSGKAHVYASTKLNISIAGSGDVFYKGKPADIKQSVAGSGNIQAAD